MKKFMIIEISTSLVFALDLDEGQLKTKILANPLYADKEKYLIAEYKQKSVEVSMQVTWG